MCFELLAALKCPEATFWLELSLCSKDSVGVMVYDPGVDKSVSKPNYVHVITISLIKTNKCFRL